MQFESFCAANSGNGFSSLFETILDERKRQVYYIKGGPGSGKSTLMRKIAKKAQEAELIICSGDPASLDGLILPEQNAVFVDATAPHSYEPHYPGVCGHVIDLGVGWAPERMNRSAIVSLCDRKSEIYRAAYHLLSAAKSIHEGVFSPLNVVLNKQRMQTLCDKILRQNALWDPQKETANVRHRYFSAITPQGCITLNRSLEALADRIVLVEDRWMQGEHLLHRFESKLTENGVDHINGYHPLLGAPHLAQIIVPSQRFALAVQDGFFGLELAEEHVMKKISMQGLLETNEVQARKNKLLFAKRLERELLSAAVDRLAEARALHMQIENEYAAGTDFSAAESIAENLIDKLFA